MSKKRPAESGWESDEDDLLTDTGISAFRHEDVDELDEDALLGMDDGTHAQGVGFEEQGQYGDGEEMLEIQVKDDELDEEFVVDEKEEQLDYYDDQYQGDTSYSHMTEEGQEGAQYEQEDAEGSYLHENVSQEEGSFHHESQDVFLNESNNSDASFQNESQDAEASYQNESHGVEEERHEEEEAKLEESDSDESGDEDKHRGRFISERSNIITLSKAKSRTNIPDTLEVSGEQQEQLNVLQSNVARYRKNRGDNGQRGGLQAYQRQEGHRGMLFRGPFQQTHRQPFGIRLHPHPQQSLPGRRQGQLPQFGQPLGFLSDARLRFGPPQGCQEGVNLGRPFGETFPGSHTEPRPLLRLPQQHGNRILLPNQQGGFNIVPRQHMGGSPLLPGQVPPGTPAPVHPQQPLLRSHQESDPPPVSMFMPQQRLGVPTAAPPRSHKIHINPNFRGPVPGAVMASHPVIQMQPEPAFSQPGVQHSSRLQTPAVVSSSGPMLVELTHHQVSQQQLLQGQPRPGPPFGQLFPQQGPRMAAPGLGQNFPPNSQITHSSLGQQQQGFLRTSEEDIIRGQGGAGLLPEPSQFPQSLLHLSHGLSTSHHLHSPPVQQHQQSTGIISTSGGLAGQTLLMQQQRRQMLIARNQRRMAVQQRVPQKQQTVMMAKKLTHQARIIQQTKATANKNITVVPLTPHKRQSTESSAEIIIPPKVARIAEPAEVEEPMDEELKRGLEEQKRKREEIRKRKEEARKRQAEIRRKELEERLAKQGLTIDDIIGDNPDQKNEAEAAPLKEMTGTPTTPKESQTTEIEGAQPITTLVSRGTQQHTQRRMSAGNQPLRPPVRLTSTKKVAEMRCLSLKRNSNNGSSIQLSQTTFMAEQADALHGQIHPQPPHTQRLAGQQPQVGLRMHQQATRMQQQQQQQQSVAKMQQSESPKMPQQQHVRPRLQQQPRLRMQQQGPGVLGPRPHLQQLQQQSLHHFQSGESLAMNPSPGQPQHHFGQHLPLSPFGHHQQHHSGEGPFTRTVPPNTHQQQFQPHQQPHLSVLQQHQMQENLHRPGEFPQANSFEHIGRGQSFQGNRMRGRGNASRGRGRNGRIEVLRQRYGQGPAQGNISLNEVPAGQAFNRVTRPSSQSQQSARTVISSKVQGAASTCVPSRTVIPLGHQPQGKRQVVKQGAMMKQTAAPQKVVAGPSTLQKVSIDNLSVSTTAQELKAYCETVGPIENNIVMLESQRKAIITFKSKIHAMTFVKKWDRRMINLSIVHVTMLP